MITAEQIKNANERIKKVNIKGKNYALVAARVAAFRDICPSGSIQTEILSLDNGVVTMQTTVKDEDGKILATGLAQEKESSSYINKTSFIENCETSAVGRALGMLGLGSDEQMSSAEELVNAITNQGTQKPQEQHSRTNGTDSPQEEQNAQETDENGLISPAEQLVIEGICAKMGLDPAAPDMFSTWPRVTKKGYADFMRWANENKGKNK